MTQLEPFGVYLLVAPPTEDNLHTLRKRLNKNEGVDRLFVHVH